MKFFNIFNKLKLYISMVRYGNAHNLDFAVEHWSFFKDLQDFLKNSGGITNKRVLDIGCGKAAWLTLLFASAGARATGIDTEVVKLGFGFKKYSNILFKNGPERFLRTLIWEIFYAQPYFKELEKQADFKLDFSGIETFSMSAKDMHFSDQSFDLIISYEVIEHIPDLEVAVKEMKRVLKPDGIMIHYLHNYTSLSGGHHIAWKYPDKEPSDIVPPWDHLRQNLFPDIPSWISRKRGKEIRDIFEKYFTIEEWSPYLEEGRALLTEQIKAELSDYSEKELLTKGFLIIARPRME